MQHLRIVKLTQIGFIIITLFLSVGCIRENRSGCKNSLFLKFRYINSNDQLLDARYPEMDHLSVFVFDGNGLFIYEQQDSAIQINDQYTLELPLYEGQYQFVVWAGLADCYTLSSTIPGHTHIENFVLQLKRDTDNHILTPPPLLYQGRYGTIDLSSDKTQEITIGLKRITNTIRVIIHYATPEVQPQVIIEDNNGTYDYHGELQSDQQFSYYANITSSSDIPNTWIADFNVMQLQTDNTARLKIYNPQNTLQYDESLIHNLLGANPNINFNTDHDFTVEITFDDYYVPVSIRINDWEIITEVVGSSLITR